MLESLTELETLCPEPVLRGKRIVRMTEKALGRFELDYQALYELGTENVGLLVGGESRNELFLDRIVQLSESDLDGTVVVATSTKKLADWCYSRLAEGKPKKRRPDVYTKGAVTLTTPERLYKVAPADHKERPVIALMLFDPMCIVYRARGDEGFGWTSNDRPQHLTKFRFEHRSDDWQPPLILLTTKPAKSLNTNNMLAPYGLEAWWYIDATTFRIGPYPQLEDEPATSGELETQ